MPSRNVVNTLGVAASTPLSVCNAWGEGGSTPVDLALLSHLIHWRLQLLQHLQMMVNRHHHGLQKMVLYLASPHPIPQVASSSHAVLTKPHCFSKR